jgi:hypothetical protein
MGKLLLAIWIFLGSLVGVNPHSATPHIAQTVVSPTATPSPTPISSEMPNELKVSRSVTPLGQKTKNPMLPFKTINDPAVVQKLYNAILALPPYPTSNPIRPPQANGCVKNPILALYELSFFKNDRLIRRGTMTILSCGGGMSISLEGTHEREFSDENSYKPFMSLLESSFGVTASQLNGAE